MIQPIRKRVLRNVGLSSAIAVTVLVSGVGVASASTHSPKSVSALALRSSRDASTTSPPPMPPRGPSGVGGDFTALTSSSITIVNFDGTASTYVINSSTVVTNLRQSATTASLALGENVRIVASSTDTSVAGSIELVPATLAGRVSAINGDTITVTGPNASADTILVSTTTTYTKSGATASLADISVGSFIFAEGTFSSSPSTIDAATVGIGDPGASDCAGPGPVGAGVVPGVPPGTVPEIGSNARGGAPK